MQMTYNKSLTRFEIKTSYMEYKAGYVQRVKDAGFRFEKTPVALWHTDSPEKASLMVACADEESKGMLSVRAVQREIALDQSRAQDADLGSLLDDIMIDPYPFQKAGVSYAMSRKRVLFGDEPGCGKTIQALATVHIKKAYPCIVISPASLKFNWRFEAIRCIPELGGADDIQILSGEKIIGKDGKDLCINQKAKMVIVNFDIAASWLPKLVAIKARSIIVDESHFLKSSDSLRAKAILELAAGVRYILKEGNKRASRVQVNQGIEYRYLLSGTPLPNRIVELESQLDILGIIDIFGGKGGFRMRYCGPEAKQVYLKGCRGISKTVYTFKGASHTNELQIKLRENAMVRRLKDDVLDELPPKRHQCIELPNEDLQHFVRDECEIEKRHEKNVSELRGIIEKSSKSGDENTFLSASAKLKKQYESHFTEMSRLSHEIGMAKYPYVIELIKDTMEVDGVDKMVVWCYHRDVVEAISKELRSIYGTKKTRQCTVDENKQPNEIPTWDREKSKITENTPSGELGGSEIWEMDRTGNNNSEQEEDSTVSMRLRNHKNSSTNHTDNSGIQGVHELSPKSMLSTRDESIPTVQDGNRGSAESLERGGSIRSVMGGDSNSGYVPITRNSSLQNKQQIQREQPIAGQDYTREGVCQGERLGYKLEGECNQKQCNPERTRANRSKLKKENDNGVVILYGGMSDAEKNRSVDLFQNDPSIRFFVGSMQAAGVGLTLTKASRCIFAELSWTPGVIDQATDRIHRIGQRDSVLATYVTLENSLDSKKVGMLNAKRDVAHRALDKKLDDFSVPTAPMESTPADHAGGIHVFEILNRLGIKRDEVPF